MGFEMQGDVAEESFQVDKSAQDRIPVRVIHSFTPLTILDALQCFKRALMGFVLGFKDGFLGPISGSAPGENDIQAVERSRGDFGDPFQVPDHPHIGR